MKQNWKGQFIRPKQDESARGAFANLPDHLREKVRECEEQDIACSIRPDWAEGHPERYVLTVRGQEYR